MPSKSSMSSMPAPDATAPLPTSSPRFVLPRTFNAGFAIGLFNKDIRLCLEEADALGVPMIVGTAVRQRMAITQPYEGYDADITEIVKPVERWAGVEGRGKVDS